jgi:hypothetical protein
MLGKGTKHQLPLVLQLVKNREEQRAADAEKNSEKTDHGLQFFTKQMTSFTGIESANLATLKSQVRSSP